MRPALDETRLGLIELDPVAFVKSLGLRDGGPRFAAVMIASVDGRAAIHGRTGGLGHPADRALMRELRTAADVILVGPRTLGTERYANLLDDEQRERRVAAGLSAHPVVATVSRTLDLPEVPITNEPVPLVVYTTSEERGASNAPPAGWANADVRRLEDASMGAVVADLGDVAIVCEGGPTLLREAFANGCVSDLLLTVSPLVTGGFAPTIVNGSALDEPVKMELRDARRADDHLFLWYTP